MQRILFGVLVVLALTVSSVWAQDEEVVATEEAAEEWSIDTANPEGTPTVLFEYEASEGTWMSLDVSPDGETIIFDLLGHIYEMPVTGGAATALTEGRSWNLTPRFSPDGTEISFTSDRAGSDDIWVMNRESGVLENLTNSPSSYGGATWSADGRNLFATRLQLDFSNNALLLNRFGNEQLIMESSLFQFVAQFVDDPARNAIYYEHGDGTLPSDGARIYRRDRNTGESEIFIQRAGGAFNPTLSPDGSMLAFYGRSDLKTALWVRDMKTMEDRAVVWNLDRDQMENLGNLSGSGTGMGWASENEIIYTSGGGFHRVNVDTGEVSDIPFTAPVRRELNQTNRNATPVAEGEQRTRIQRFSIRTDQGIISESLGDLYLYGDGVSQNITNSDMLETSPAYDQASGTLYYAGWSDAALGAIYRQSIKGGAPEKLTDLATQYGALALSNDGSMLAYLRARGDFQNGQRLEAQADFELMVMADGESWKVTDINADFSTGNRGAIRRASGIRFSLDGEGLYFAEFDDEGLVLKYIDLSGKDERILYRFPKSSRVVISPDFNWIAFREYHRSYVTPFEFVGGMQTVSAADGEGYTQRIHTKDGAYLGWNADGSGLHWMRGTDFYEKSLEAVLAGDEQAATTDISIVFEAAMPTSTIALTNARVITVNGDRDVLEGATVLVVKNRIAAIGKDVDIPSGAQVFDLSGQTIMPGIVDAHGHYGGDTQSYLHVVEQNVSGLLSPLAYGVTTLYEVYGTNEKDPWVRDRVDAGLAVGPRLYSVGTPIFGMTYRKALLREITGYEDAYEHLAYNQAFGAEAVKDYTVYSRRARHGIATAARELGMNDVAETAANLQMNLTQVVDGLTGLEHSMGMTPLYDDVVAMLAATEIGITPTLIVVYNGPSGETWFHHEERVWENEKLLQFQTRDELLRVRRPTFYWEDEHYAPEMARQLHKLYDAGISLQLGAHGQMSGLDAHWEMEIYQQGGLSPADIIDIATINGAN